MRILLDEQLNVRLRHLFGEDVQAETVTYRDWKGVRNGDLLERASKEYGGFLTFDQSLPSQQNVAGLDLRVVVLEAATDDFDDLAPLIPLAEAALREMMPGEVRYVSAPA